MVEVSTAKVFAQLGLAPGETLPHRRRALEPPSTAQMLQSRNDLQAPAIAIAPVIGDVLAALAGMPGRKRSRA